MDTSSMTNLLPALMRASDNFDPVFKDNANDFFNSKYATLKSVFKACRQQLRDEGIMVLQPTRTEGGRQILVTMVVHIESGEKLISEWELHPTKADPQGEGSALTYTRRYQFLTILGLAPEDDDGNEATRSTTTPPKDWHAEIAKASNLAEAKAVGNGAFNDGKLSDDLKAKVEAAIAKFTPAAK